MIRRVESKEELEAAQALCRRVAADEAALAPAWLTHHGARVIAQESGRHVELAEAPAIIDAFVEAGAHNLIAITNDPLVGVIEAYEMGVTADDLLEVCNDLIGVNFVLVDGLGEQCILFTTYDFKLIAGSLGFVTAVVGEPRAARDAFLEFAVDQPGSLRAAALRAADYMDWVDAS